jgi:hypothetical protein
VQAAGMTQSGVWRGCLTDADRNVRGEPEASDHVSSWVELKSRRRGG